MAKKKKRVPKKRKVARYGSSWWSVWNTTTEVSQRLFNKTVAFKKCS